MTNNEQDIVAQAEALLKEAYYPRTMSVGDGGRWIPQAAPMIETLVAEVKRLRAAIAAVETAVNFIADRMEEDL